MSAALKDDPPDMDTLPEGLDLLVQHCIEKDPAHRFQSANDLAFHLRAVSSTSTTGKKLPPLPRPAKPRTFTMRRILALAGGAVLVLAALEAGLRLGRLTPPSYHPLTFRRGMIFSARFAPDAETVIYGASWDGQPLQVYSTRPESPESRSLGFQAGDILAVSHTGELALCTNRRTTLGWESRGTLARAAMAGGAPREILTDVESADWAPDGQTFAVVHVVDGRYRLEFPLGHVLYESNGWLSNVRVSPSGNHLAFMEHPVRSDDRGDVCVVDSDGQDRRVLAADFASVSGLAWSSDHDLWFTASAVGGRTTLFSVDLRGKSHPITEAPGRLSLLDVRSGLALLTESRLRLRVAVREVPDGPAADREMSWLDASVGADLSDDGRVLLMTEQGAQSGAASYGTYLRRTDGSPAVRLGDGLAQSLSPDGLFAASIGLGVRQPIMLLPTGPGAVRTLISPTVTHVESVAWFPDGRRLVFAGNKAGDPVRLYVQDVDGGDPRSISAAGVTFPFPCKPVSPDGKLIAALDRGGNAILQPVAGGEPRPVPATRLGDIPIRWSADGRSLYFFRRDEQPAQIRRVDLSPGTASQVAEVAPSDRAGVRPLIAVQLTPDGRFCAYSYSQTLSDLYVVRGLR